jgi:Na+-transporting NADH:ubiquinone oxidoreductase subunit A
MSQLLTIKKGLDLKLAGGIGIDSNRADIAAQQYAVTPSDFPGLTPKVEVAEGESVAAGQALLHDKTDERIKIVAPVAGKVSAIVRGERRRIEHIIIDANGSDTRHFDVKKNMTAEEAKTLLMESGLWALMRQRPFDIIPQPDSTARDIFVTAFDSAPLAPNIVDNLNQQKATLEAAVKLLSLLTSGKVFISRRQGSLDNIAGAEMVDVVGPHPAGNAGIQIANIAPVNKGETVWTLDITTLWRIGNLVETGVSDWHVDVAIVGPETKTPQIIKTYAGAEIKALVADNLADDNRHKRIISGNVLTGIKVGQDDFLRYPYRQVTVIAEGDDVDEFMGWASLSAKKMSQSRSFPGHFLFKKLFSPDARLLGGRRALIMSGEYDKYLPMDIMAEYLLKAIIGRDIEQMEQLGIYEIAPEDLTLGEYADTSKLEAQKIVRDGLDYLRKELQ